jgi:hypothetical protein
VTRYSKISALGSRAARNLDLSRESVGVVVIGHGAPWEERCELAAHFRETLPGVPIVASLRQRDRDVAGADSIYGQIIRLSGWKRSGRHLRESGSAFDDSESRYDKGTIRDDARYRSVSTDVRRHRLISVSYISLLPCHRVALSSPINCLDVVRLDFIPIPFLALVGLLGAI